MSQAKDQFSTQFSEGRLLRDRLARALESIAGEGNWPESLHWGHVGELGDICRGLEEQVAHLERLARSIEAARQAEQIGRQLPRS